MNLLDMRTVLLGFAVSNLICVVVMGLLWRQNRRRFEGLGLWLADYALQFLSLLLLCLRGRIPDLLSMTGGSLTALAGTVLLYRGLERFLHTPGSQRLNVLLLVLFAIVHPYFVLAVPSLAARSVLFSAALAVLCARCAWLMLRRAAPEMRPITAGTGYVFGAFALVSLLRVAVDLAVSPGDDFLRANAFETLMLMTYQMLFIVLTFLLVLMVNRRLFADLEADIAARAEAEASLRLSEEKFFKAFQASPDAILISRLRDGRLVEVNEGFCRLTGYTREEALAHTSLALNLWENPEDRESVVRTIEARGRVREAAYDFRLKSGRIMNGLLSAEVIRIGREPHLLSVVRDVTGQRQTERILELRLQLWEFAADRPIEQLMQRAIDEIEAMTGSRIAFYHIVDEPKGMLTLQAWSTRTGAEFCQARGEGLHYPIADAGVWVDAIHERRPVIHNDYDSLPHRRGLPPGHAEVIRELVVPTLRDGRVVSVLGVGNKPEPYDEKDVALVASIADVVWTIVAQRRAEEQIRWLNGELAQLALTDALTGLANRRSFFFLGEEELKRTRRYGTPLALIMLDIDRFKGINDRHGHEAGDRVLAGLARILRENVREVDMAARLGGEEFGIILPNTRAADAVGLAERLRAAVEAQPHDTPAGRIGVTVSLGVAACSDRTADLDALLRLADAALYEAKRQGRNQVVLLSG